MAMDYEDVKKEHQVRRKETISKELANFQSLNINKELLITLNEIGFDHPSDVQSEAIPRALLGGDLLCQAKSGLGKTAVYVITILHQIKPQNKELQAIVLVPTKEIVVQVSDEFKRFIKNFNNKIEIEAVYGGLANKEQEGQIIIGTTGKVLDMVSKKQINTNSVQHFVLDECDQLLGKESSRALVQSIFFNTPKEKQVMMFSATLNERIRRICLLYLRSPFQVFVDDEKSLTLHGLKQFYIKMQSNEKKKTLQAIMKSQRFNQAIIFVNDKFVSEEVVKLLSSISFPSIDIHSGLSTEERITRFDDFKFKKYKILVATDLMSRGIDVQDINLVINYDLPESPNTYLHRIGRAGRFETNGTAFSFVSTRNEAALLNLIQERFDVPIKNFTFSD